MAPNWALCSPTSSLCVCKGEDCALLLWLCTTLGRAFCHSVWMRGFYWLKRRDTAGLVGSSCPACPVIMLTLRGHHQPRRCDSSKGIPLTSSRLELTPHTETRTALPFHLAWTLSGTLTTAAPNNEQEPSSSAPCCLGSTICSESRPRYAPQTGLDSALQWHHLRAKKGLPGLEGAGIFQHFQCEGDSFWHGNQKVKPEKGSLEKKKKNRNTRHITSLSKNSFQSPYTKHLAQTNHVTHHLNSQQTLRMNKHHKIIFLPMPFSYSLWDGIQAAILDAPC